jgi:hypothetical protein
MGLVDDRLDAGAVQRDRGDRAGDAASGDHCLGHVRHSFARYFV